MWAFFLKKLLNYVCTAQLAIFLAFFIASSCAYARSINIYSKTFDGTDERIDELMSFPKPEASDSLVVDCNIGYLSPCSLRTTIRGGKEYITFNAYRIEVSTERLPKTFYTNGDVFRYRFSFNLSSDWVFDVNNSSSIIWQFKRTSASPDMFISIYKGQLILRAVGGVSIVLLKSIPKSTWITLSMNVAWSIKDDGRVSVSVLDENASELNFVSFQGRNMQNVVGSKGYLKWGLYMPDIKEWVAPSSNWSLLHDGVEIIKVMD
jgi:hypothetical protein